MTHWIETLLLSTLPVIVRFDIRIPFTMSLVASMPSPSMLVPSRVQTIAKASPAHEKVASCPNNTLVEFGWITTYKNEGKYA